MVVAQVFAYLGAIGVSLLALPQLFKILRDRDSAGVSVWAWIFQAACCGTFLIYGIVIFEPAQIVGNVLPVIGALAVALMAVSARRTVTFGLIAISAMIGAAYIAVMFAIPPLMVGFVGTGLSIIARWPQIVDSIRSSRNGKPTNVSTTTWYFFIGGMGAWMVYGIIALDYPVLITNLIGILSAVVILIAEYRNPGNRAFKAEAERKDVALANV